ncbi:MAG: hypothetical protein PHN29_06430, partial [Endomicrobiaceae bacterium]|nr:hypothetical protein [Endomicrobiaceae bacterium]
MLKNNCIALLTVFLLILFITACQGRQTLSIPENFKVEGSIITWTDVKNAAKYRIEIENIDTGIIQKRIVACGDDLNNYNITPVNYHIRLQAIGTGKKWLDSPFTEAL